MPPVHESDPTPSRRGARGAFSRRTALGALGMSAGALATAGAAAPSLADPGPGLGAQRTRARAAVEAIDATFATGDGTDLLLERFPQGSEDPPSSYEWPLSQARAATCELAYAPGEPRGDLTTVIASRDRAQELYWHPEGGDTGLPGYASATRPPDGAEGDYFYDDNAWVGMLEVQEHLLSGGARGDLPRALEVYALLRSGWDQDPSHPSPGGIWWAQTDWNDDRNTVSNMPTAKLGLRLHQITGDPAHLDFALQCREWTRDTLLSPDGLFWDNIKLDGSIDRTFWTYNQGVPLGVEALLYATTGAGVYRRTSLEIVEAVIDHFRPFEEGGPLDEQPTAFNAILCSNLLMAESILGPDVPGRRIVAACAERQWRNLRDPETNLFRRDEDQEHVELLDHAGFARTQVLAALPRPAWAHLT